MEPQQNNLYQHCIDNSAFHALRAWFQCLEPHSAVGPGSCILDLEDFFISNNLLPLGSLVYLLFCTQRYGWGWNNFIKEADTGNGLKFPKWMRFYVTYILPLIVLVIFINGYAALFK